MTTSQNTRTMSGKRLESVRRLAAQLRVDSIRCSTQAGSGHPTSSLSAADLMTVLLSGHLHYDWGQSHQATNDHLIFSKGHASPLLYSMFRAVGVVDEDELVNTYRQFGARLEGHPTPVLPWVDVATGSLGQGLPDAVGVCLAGKYLDKLPFHVWVLCGDSETAEGSIWEALDKASYYQLGNLTAIVDVNRLGQRGPTELEWNLDQYAARVAAFGCHRLIVDGHDLVAIDQALTDARRGDDQPTVVLARTVKAKGVPELEDKNGWHGKALPPEMAERAIAALGGVSQQRITTTKPEPGTPSITADPTTTVTLPTYELGEKVATRVAFGAAIAALAARPEVVVIDGEVGNSTHADEFGKGLPRAVLRDVHRRAAARRHRRRTGRPRIRAVRRHLRGLLLPCLRLHPDGRHLPGEHPSGRLARRRRDRRGWTLPDGPGGPGRVAGRARLGRALPR